MTNLTRRRLVTLAGTGAAALAIGRPGPSTAQTANPIKIGALIPLSGPQAVFGKDIQLGAEIAAAQINAAGGVMGRKLELVFRDDKADPNQTVAGARELAGDGINLFIDGLFTSNALAFVGILRDLNSIMIGCGAVADSLTHEKFQRNFFRIHDHTYLKCQGLAHLMAERYPKVNNWGASFSDVEPGWNSYKSFVSGAKKFYPELAKATPAFAPPTVTRFGTADFKNQISTLMSQDIDGMFFNLNGDEAVTFFIQARAFGLADKIKVFADLGQELLLAKALGKNMPPNFWSGTHWYYGAYPDNKMSKALYDDYVARTGNTAPAGYSQTSHAIVYAYASAIRAGGSTETETMIKTLEGMTFDTARGPITFRKEDHQAIGDTNFIKLGPSDKDPGWMVSDYAKVPGGTTVEPSAPGIALKYD